jgi:hypothetical protein
MKIKISIVFVFYCFTAFGQNSLCWEDIIDKKEVFETNEIEKYTKYDFSNLWTKTENELVYGIIGADYQRIVAIIVFRIYITIAITAT